MKARILRNWLGALCVVALARPAPAHAEDGAAGWLRYAPLPEKLVRADRALPSAVVALDGQAEVLSAQSELASGLESMLGRRVAIARRVGSESLFVLGTVAEVEGAAPGWHPALRPGPEGFVLDETGPEGHRRWIVAGADERGVLYGVFRLLERVAAGEHMDRLADAETPAAPIRWVNQWDNLDGTIERGCAGRSFFFENGAVRRDLTRAGQYARLLASVGTNGCTVNNVNADLRMLTPEIITGVARIADEFRPWGVRLSLAVDLSSPQKIGGLPTFDPADPRVAAWWREKVDAIYRQIPDFAGFVVKADSEGRAGPSQYGRTPDVAANMLARALKPHGGVVLYRAFVYNHHLDWRDAKADRARAAYDIFAPLDGKFDENVVLQIKHGPIDFQVREPVSPVFAAMRRTNTAIELQITQEYTGQQRHLFFPITMWNWVLNTDLRAGGRSTPVKAIVEGRSFHRPLGGFVAVANAGLDTNWMGHPLAMANLYGFGRQAWNPDTAPATIARAWTRLTFGNDPRVVATVSGMLLRSWRTYEDYTGPLGLGTLTDILHSHYGPGIESAERNGWGQWIRADHEGVGMDRTVATGTGFIGQYPPQLARAYASLATCPDDLLLFMHHVPYTHRLHSGETVIQHIYNAHYRGADEAQGLETDWEGLRGLVDPERYARVLALQEYQAGHAIVWRDAITNWFHRESGIADARGRVGHYPDRIEAESMTLDGYVRIAVTPWETASGGEAVACRERARCAASVRLQRSAGRYEIAVQYFDYRDGISRYSLLLNGRQIGAWKADNTLPGNQPNGDTSTRYVLRDVALKPGDTLTIIGRPGNGEPAPLDYISVRPMGVTREKRRPASR